MDDTVAPAVAKAREALGSRSDVIGSAAGASPPVELFHAPNSICSQKVRSVLAHHRLPYVSHPVNLFEGQSYLPDYVRLRMLGCESFGGALVAHHSGSTSASAGGCDGAVVPTLVDRRSGAVIVDSKRICLHLDAEAPEADRLRPPERAADVDAELAVVDNLPNYQMLMGRTPAASESGATAGDVAGRFSQRKVAWCDLHLREHADDPALVAAYTAKRAKEASAAAELFSPEAMTAAYGRAETALHELQRKLERNEGSWLFGDAFTMADLFWGVELLRMKNMGVASFWESGRLPQVEAFSAATEALPAIRTAIIDWPGAMF